jgi:isoleucyl-tRNA synthetase
VQEARKDAGLAVSDRIVLDIEGNDTITATLAAHRSYVEAETLASRWERLEAPLAQAHVPHKLGDASWVIRLRRDEAWRS